MNIGIGVMYSEIEDFKPVAADLDDKLARIAENKRKDLTVEQLLSWINQEHLETVGVLHWLRTLTDYIPELAKYKPERYFHSSRSASGTSWLLSLFSTAPFLVPSTEIGPEGMGSPWKKRTSDTLDRCAGIV